MPTTAQAPGTALSPSITAETTQASAFASWSPIAAPAAAVTTFPTASVATATSPPATKPATVTAVACAGAAIAAAPASRAPFAAVTTPFPTLAACAPDTAARAFTSGAAAPSVAPAPDSSFNTFEPSLLDRYYGVTAITLVRDDFIPGILVGVRLLYASWNPSVTPDYTETISSSIYDPTSPGLHETVIDLYDTPPLSSITACCSVVGGLSGISVNFADGSRSNGDGSCELPSTRRRAQETEYDYGEGGLDARTVPVPGNVAVFGVRGSQGFALGSVSFVLVQRRGLGLAAAVAAPAAGSERRGGQGTNDKTDPVVATARYGRGRAAAFGGEALVLNCCHPKGNPKQNIAPSDPGVDMLIINIAKWASWYGTKTGGKASLRVSDPRFSPMAKFIALNAEDTFLTLKAMRKSSWHLPLDVFMRGGWQSTDVYVLSAYDPMYQLPNVRAKIDEFVTHGKSVILVGPAAMPSMFYDKPKRRVLQEDSHDAEGVDDSPATSTGAGANYKRRMLLQRRGLGQAGMRGLEEGQVDEWASTIMGRRVLQSSASTQSIDSNSIGINSIAGPMGLTFSGFISDPGGSLTVATPSEDQNAALAAQKLLQYLQGAVTLSTKELAIVVGTVSKARASVTRGAASTQQFFSILDSVDAMAAKRPAFPPLSLDPPPPPPKLRPPSPQPPSPAPSPPASSGLPSGVVYMGCYADLPGAASGLPTVIVAADRLNSVDRCTSSAANVSARATSATARINFVGLMRASCSGAAMLPLALLTSQLPESTCTFTCPGAPSQKCGGLGNATRSVISVYRVLASAAV
ncbi:hypothetical protein GPECTOR_6g768 [Gonium pectorale]|uniref:WSC domain-containing protein n=1 Tax=Gonium pectorale TaxID=33097 RepID=A0A150GWV7_GONPE|nr:hypothetical protein GPECTOR_6g768 [Gonium pectorale]|eukprot:KXZ53850.1 hypothetical protein GPECTOR_6g768 [Gonium pectorale]